jgi:hypothetical protein
MLQQLEQLAGTYSCYSSMEYLKLRWLLQQLAPACTIYSNCYSSLQSSILLAALVIEVCARSLQHGTHGSV